LEKRDPQRNEGDPEGAESRVEEAPRRGVEELRGAGGGLGRPNQTVGGRRQLPDGRSQFDEAGSLGVVEKLRQYGLKGRTPNFDVGQYQPLGAALGDLELPRQFSARVFLNGVEAILGVRAVGAAMSPRPSA
jgi:hypothetical protein